MLQRHDPPQPQSCDVCREAIEQGRDVEAEHALVRLATVILLDALEELDGGPARLAGLVVARFPPHDTGPVHRLEPRHYYWALFHEPDIQLVLRGRAER